MYIAINLMTLEPRAYETKEFALEDCVRLNRADEEHPAFTLWRVEPGKTELGYEGRLFRAFGRSEFSWRRDLV